MPRYGVHLPDQAERAITEDVRRHLNAELHKIMQILESQRVGCVKSRVGEENPKYTVEFIGNQLGPIDPSTDVRFTAQVVGNYIVLTTPLDSNRVYRVHHFAADREYYNNVITPAEAGPHWDFSDRVSLRSHDLSWIHVAYDSLGQGLENKVLTFRAGHRREEHLAWFIDLLLASVTRVQTVYQDMRENPERYGPASDTY